MIGAQLIAWLWGASDLAFPVADALRRNST
jgi:hypothetical protein